jgi:hypothetical protein
MTDAPLPARFAGTDFRIGPVFSQTSSVLSRNLLIFLVVTVIANVPPRLLTFSTPATFRSGVTFLAALQTFLHALLTFLGPVLVLTLATLSQAIVLFGAFQDMRGHRVSLAESLKVCLGRILPIIGLAILMSLGIVFGFVLLVIPGLILATMWFVATPACVVERLGPFDSMARSSELTKGHRWKILGLFIVLAIGGTIASGIIDFVLEQVVGSATLTLVGGLVWNGVWGAFYAIAAVVTYHDLRVAKEGVDIEQIAAVFD